jgi:septal ring factor EnvC (AmiA/AmiB activator)
LDTRAPSEPEAQHRLRLASGPERQSLSRHRVAEALTDVIGACAAAANELAKARGLVEALETENKAVRDRLEIEKSTALIMQELIETQHLEAEALRSALNAKNETIAAKDAMIDSQDKLIEALKKKKTSLWRRLTDILIGAAVIAVLK